MHANRVVDTVSGCGHAVPVVVAARACAVQLHVQRKGRSLGGARIPLIPTRRTETARLLSDETTCNAANATSWTGRNRLYVTTRTS
ncbi:hypothetical protein E2562_007047 [Oryza meyeriana var. granulata]|uniref:Uncharacterized protein n=1 Tax=Oryza meyeriana var. granulata TaxID=110450 RepID=A0A6G1EAA5_9ORYZ|nr:hypothetical protein E2562_007047 [Oryza meyeriana var. granulata]